MNTTDMVNPITTTGTMSLASSWWSYSDLPSFADLGLPHLAILVLPGPAGFHLQDPTHLRRPHLAHLEPPDPAQLGHPDLPYRSMDGQDYLAGLYSGQTKTSIPEDPSGRP
uniref:Uncharacterized protein n=1 Tax=Cannabis sativa TaxID=3483 RepID=A0A803QA94_CANSA